ncbi:hypothetical protein HI914_03906 [Erysiphe necator]|nr:hypothetical protein HI914_03906 [Erysiphe necator]
MKSSPLENELWITSGQHARMWNIEEFVENRNSMFPHIVIGCSGHPFLGHQKIQEWVEISNEF